MSSSAPTAFRSHDAGQPFTLDGCIAIVTGASSGLGAEFARQLAPRASCLFLAARSADALEKLAAELRKDAPSLRVVVCPCDLATDEGRAALWAKVDAENLQPNALINNAGLGDYGLFVEAEVKRIRQQIDVNITALTLLAHEFARRISARNDGKPTALLNLSSLASTMPIPDLAVYAATKSYVSSLSEGIAVELAPKNLRVLAVCPGPSPTNFGSTARREGEPDIDRGTQDLIKVPPQKVVSTSLQALEQGKRRHFPGTRVAIVATFLEKMPRGILRWMIQKRFEKESRRESAAAKPH